MTTATSPFCSCGAVAGGTSAAFGARAGGLSDYDLDRYRHALTQRGIGIGDHDPQTIDQIRAQIGRFYRFGREPGARRSEEPTSELQSLMRISYAVYCLTKNNTTAPI